MASCSETKACPNETDACLGIQLPGETEPVGVCMPYGTISSTGFRAKILDDPSKIPDNQTAQLAAIVQNNTVNSTMPWTPKPNFSQQSMAFFSPADEDLGTADSYVLSTSGLIGMTESWQFMVIAPKALWKKGDTLTVDENTDPESAPLSAQVVKVKGNLMANQINEVWIKAIMAGGTLKINEPGVECDASAPAKCPKDDNANVDFSIDMLGFDVSLNPAVAG
jgi:hypothetical protein